MTSVTQTIPTLTAGISQQPDDLKLPGQVSSAKNVLPDVTLGLIKRPGSKFIASLSDNGTSALNSSTNGRWFSYYRDETEQYIGQITRAGDVNMWRCSDGASMTVNYDSGTSSALTNYLTHTDDEQLQTLTLNDITYVTNRTKTVAMTSTVETARPPEVFLELKRKSYASQYSVDLYDSTSTTTVYTATRIDIDREVDSGNSCTSDGQTFAPSGTEPGTGSYTSWCYNTNNPQEDGMCPNVAVRIFSISNGDSGIAADKNNIAHTYSVTANGGSASDRKDLIFRIDTTGQALPESDVGNPKYTCRYRTQVELLHGGQGWRTGDFFYVWMENAKYKITVKDHSESSVKANLGLIRPTPTAFDTQTTVTTDSILGGIRKDVIATGNFSDANVQTIGNGLYITRASGSFNAASSASELLTVVSGEVNDVAELPRQCKHGMIVKVANSTAEEDDYFVKFFGHNDRDGEGVWEECVKPGENIQYDAATLPIQIQRLADGTFKVEQISWTNALVGTTGENGTNPRGSFVGSTINKLLFFRNRLVILSDENVIMSQPGDFYNFWAKTAVTFSSSDMIDLSCSSEYPAIVYDGIQVNSGLILFTKNQQFMLTTDSDVLSSNTAKINSLSSYNFNIKSNPVSLGTTIGFLDDAGKYSRFWEMAGAQREGEPQIIEQSKVVSRLFDKNITLVAISRENGLILFGEKNKNILYGYKYFDVGQKRIQQAWFTWELTGTIQHHCVLDDSLYAVVRNNSKDQLQRIDLKLDTSSNTIVDDDIIYRIHLDNIASVTTASNTYNATTNKTTFAKPTGFESTNQIVAIDIDSGNNITRYGAATVNGSNLELDGDWKSETFKIGYLFDMEVKLPTFYYKVTSGNEQRVQQNNSLILHRLKVFFGTNGLFKTKLSRTGRADYEQTYESTTADTTQANAISFLPEKVQNVPIYDRNTNVTITISSSHPSPTTLYSLAWEGDLTNKNYRVV
tara:strand:+ start:479 stop:3388 length:2910 start_codon:yes stop_codon:yes gene_type:complete